MTTIIRAAGAADFLALVPRLLGYRARRSLVLIPFDGNRTLGAMRLDLPGADLDAAERERVSSTTIGMVCKVSHTDAVAVVVYTDDSVADAEGLPHDELVSSLLAHADRCGLRVSEALCVGADAWGSYLDPECPDGGRPLADIPYDHEAFDDEPLPTDDQTSGAALPEVGLAERERLGRALADIDGAMAGLFGGPASVDGDDGDPVGAAADASRIAPAALVTVCRMDDVPLLYEEALTRDPAELDPYEAGALVWCLSRPGLRDVALVQWASDLTTGDEAFEAQLRHSDGETYPEHLAARIWGDAPAPDAGRLQSALDLTRRLAAASPRAARPGVLAAAAWLAWALGRSSHAGRYAELAREIEPDHVMAGIVLTFAANAHLPEWVYERAAPQGRVTRIIDSRGVES